MKPVMDEGVSEHRACELQAGLDALNISAPFDMHIPFYSGNVRHECVDKRATLDVKERYVRAWASEDDDETHAIMYKEGVCPRCGFVARSEQGRVVLVKVRPPMFGRVSRRG